MRRLSSPESSLMGSRFRASFRVIICAALCTSCTKELMSAGAGAGAGEFAAKSQLSKAERDHQLATYSIVARDPKTGALGVAVQSHWFQVGKMVPWAEPGVGAIATQALTNASFGPRGLELLRQGNNAGETLELLLASDPKADNRQVAVVDNKGRVAVWTGKSCIQAAGHQEGEGFSVQANMMQNDEVWPAMAEAFVSTNAPLEERLLEALLAAERSGGDIRGAQSAALLVVGPDEVEHPLLARETDLRVADNRTPLKELGRLLRMQRAYEAHAKAGSALESKQFDRAASYAAKAAELAPQSGELPFWHAVSLYESGQRNDALALFESLFAKAPSWRPVLERLPTGGILTEKTAQRILRATSERKGAATNKNRTGRENR